MDEKAADSENESAQRFAQSITAGANMRGSTFFFVFAIFLSLAFSDSTLFAQGGRMTGARRVSQAEHGLAKPKAEIKVRLPDDSEKPVLVLDNVGGFRMKNPDGFEPTPMLQIFSDGRVLTGRKSPLVKDIEGRIDLVDLQKLLVFVSDDCRFFDLTSEMLKSDIEANRMARIMDAPTTQLEVNLKGHSNRVSVYGLPFGPEKLAEVPSIASMLAILSQCKRLIATTRLGSEQDAAIAIAAVNKALIEHSTTAPEFTLNDIRSAQQFADGRRSANFVKSYQDKGKRMMAYATLERNGDGKASVTLDVVETKRQGSR